MIIRQKWRTIEEIISAFTFGYSLSVNWHFCVRIGCLIASKQRATLNMYVCPAYTYKIYIFYIFMAHCFNVNLEYHSHTHTYAHIQPNVCVCLHAQELCHWHPLNWKWNQIQENTEYILHSWSSLKMFQINNTNNMNWNKYTEKERWKYITLNTCICSMFRSNRFNLILKMWVDFGVLFCFYYCSTKVTSSRSPDVCVCVCITRHAFHNIII